MTISAKVIVDSVSPNGIRLTTMQLRYPKFIHGEAKTHRVMNVGDKAYEFLQEIGFMDDPNLSRNASSSRAIPVERLIQDVLDDPAMPVFWGKNQKGMQAIEELMPVDKENAIKHWLLARDSAVRHARDLHARGVHKQIVNRLIEPWCHINVVCTATEWSNFFALRRHPDAQPEMRALAEAMWEAREASTPKLLQPGEWHLPYITDQELHNIKTAIAIQTPDIVVLLQSTIDQIDMKEVWSIAIKLSVARCARVSYLTHEGKPPNVEDDLKLYDRLVGSTPLHASPAEHQATPDTQHEIVQGRGWPKTEKLEWCHLYRHGNFVGWRQYRKMLPNENVKDR